MAQSLSSQQQVTLLVELLQDRSGVELAKCLLQRSAAGKEPEPRQVPQLTQGPQEWCICGKHRHMDNPVERMCCKMRPCVTTTDMFHDIALNRNVLAVGVLSASDF